MKETQNKFAHTKHKNTQGTKDRMMLESTIYLISILMLVQELNHHQRENIRVRSFATDSKYISQKKKAENKAENKDLKAMKCNKLGMYKIKMSNHISMRNDAMRSLFERAPLSLSMSR